MEFSVFLSRLAWEDTQRKRGGRFPAFTPAASARRVPCLHVIGMGLQAGPRFEKPVVELQVEVVRLKVHDEEDGGRRSREFSAGVEDVLGLQGHALAEFLAVDWKCL
jgi:hypothetical protein